MSQKRLLKTLPSVQNPQPFTVYNAGLYNYEALRSLSWQAYRAFVLKLFQCRDFPFNLGGVQFDGLLGDSRVLVYNFKEHPDATIGEPFVKDIARLCGARLGERCLIIAPAAAVEPYEDYLDAGGTRFYFLRIPYSVIAELHKRAFSALRQPASESSVNTTIDSVGFDFIVPPHVDVEMRQSDRGVAVVLRDFEAQGLQAGEHKAFEAFAMVMVDYDYDGEVFQPDAVHFAEDLGAARWTFQIPFDELGGRSLIVWLDVFGNEHRQPLELKAASRKIETRGAKRRTVGGRTVVTAKKTTTAAKTTEKKTATTTKMAKRKATMGRGTRARATRSGQRKR
jgi:site-specific DNA-methyltransferase (adenine-specific)/adenine-specific DNA-methyltransferase